MSNHPSNYVDVLIVGAGFRASVRDFKSMEKFGVKLLKPKEFLQYIGEAK